jgi:hypothetical protein
VGPLISEGSDSSKFRGLNSKRRRKTIKFNDMDDQVSILKKKKKKSLSTRNISLIDEEEEEDDDEDIEDGDDDLDNDETESSENTEVSNDFEIEFRKHEIQGDFLSNNLIHKEKRIDGDDMDESLDGVTFCFFYVLT